MSTLFLLLVVTWQGAGPSLLTLSAESAGLGDLGCARVCRALQRCPQLQTLVLRKNAMGRAGAVELAVLIGGSGVRGGKEAPPLLLSEGARPKVSLDSPGEEVCVCVCVCVCECVSVCVCACLGCTRFCLCEGVCGE